MEDAHVILDDFAPGLAYYGVYDGHGGKEAAEVTAEILHEKIKKSEGFPASLPDSKQSFHP